MSPIEDFGRAVIGLQRCRVPRTLDRERSELAKWIIAVRGPLSQEAFAEKLDVSRTTVADWERDNNAPELKHVLKMIGLAPHAPLPGQKIGSASSLSSEYTARIGAMLAGLSAADCEKITAMVAEVAATFRARAIRKAK